MNPLNMTKLPDAPPKGMVVNPADQMDLFSKSFWVDLIRTNSAHSLQAMVQILFVVLLVVAARIIINRIISKAMKAVVQREESAGRPGSAARARTIGGLLKSISSYVLVFIAAFTVLLAMGINAAAVVTTASVMGLAIGFGAQKLVKDVIAGFFILFENQYAVGEYVTIGTFNGVVEEIGMRTTWMRDDVGRMVIISNGDVTTVTNHSRGALVTAVEIGVASGSDLNRVCAILRKVGAEFAKSQPEDVFSPFACDGVAAMDGTKTTLRMIGRVNPLSQEQVQLDLRRVIRDALVKEGIEIA